ncbi:MAG: SDR family NAD(P)-dependent oxidoreductase [Syntrophaceae bacterium]|nr:SDR family NAD(P)-dependent oxidoreductase [Syntrophaceae bacterium]
MNDLKGKTAIITGASAGIGEMITRKLYAEGTNVILIARTKGPLDNLTSQFEPQRVASYAMNVTDYAAFSRVIAEAKDRWGAIDFLINNAGAHNRGNVMSITPEKLIQMVQVNLEAPIVLTRMILDVFIQQRRGMIINIASLAGKTPVDGAATYSATKFGLRAFTYALAEELRQTYPDIKCCLVSPGPVMTGFIMNELDNVADLVFSQPLVKPEVVAEKVVQTAKDSKIERITGGALSGIMTDIGYLFPGMKRALKPLLIAKGKRVKETLKKQSIRN